MMNTITLLLSVTAGLVVRVTNGATTRPTTAQLQQQHQQETFLNFLFTGRVAAIATATQGNATTAAKDGGPAACDLTQASGCVERGFDRVLVPLAYFVLSRDVDTLVSEVCGSYLRYRGCVRRAAGDACSAAQTLPFDMGIAAFDFLCTSPSKTVSRAWKCLSSNGLRNQIRDCSNRIDFLTPSRDACQLESNYSSCVVNMLSRVCDLADLTAMKSWFSATIQPFKALFGCADYFSSKAPIARNTTSHQDLNTTTAKTTDTYTTTATRPAMIGCYDCISGTPGRWQNPQCPQTGAINTEYVTSTPCPTACFARINQWPKGEVYRGCSAGYEWTFPAGFPTHGCFTASNGDKWCFCNSHNCNTMDMTAHQV